MFAYCNNNPITYTDSLGTRCVAANRDWSGSAPEQGIIEGLLDAMTDHREDSSTYSVGFNTSGSWGGTTGGASCCISADNTYNYAAQKTDTVGASSSIGVGASVGFNLTFTNANNVQDLSGASTSVGFTLCTGVGISVDWITFVPASDPSVTKHGISIGICIGTEYEVHAGESYTTSTNSWNPLRKLKELF